MKRDRWNYHWSNFATYCRYRGETHVILQVLHYHAVIKGLDDEAPKTVEKEYLQKVC